jgi:hypothetical protein
MKKMNKHGWIRIVEAFIAIMIILGAVLVIMSQRPSNNNAVVTTITDRETGIIEFISKNDSLRTQILAGNTAPVNSAVGKMMPYNLNFTTNICNVTEICSYGVPIDRDVYVKDVLISSNLTQYSPKKLRLFVWEK